MDEPGLPPELLSVLCFVSLGAHCNRAVGWDVGDARVRGKVGKSGVHNRGPVMGTLYCGNS